MNTLLKQPGAWVPIAISLIVLATMFFVIAISGPPVRQPDEGVGAHLFQIWLVLEMLMVAFFGIQWLPQKPKGALLILTIQIAAVFLACAPVYFFNL